MENFSPRDLIDSSDFVLAGDSSLCYESIILGKKNTIRLYNEKYQPLNDLDDGLSTIKDHKNLQKYLNNQLKVPKINPKNVERNFFFKYDKQAHIRLKRILKKI